MNNLFLLTASLILLGLALFIPTPYSFLVILLVVISARLKNT